MMFDCVQTLLEDMGSYILSCDSILGNTFDIASHLELVVIDVKLC